MDKKFDDIDDNPFSFEDFESEEIHFEEPPTEAEKVKTFVAELPLLNPREIFDELEKLGYKGQDEQRRALSLMAYRHVRRLKRLYVEEVDRAKLPTKQNVFDDWSDRVRQDFYGRTALSKDLQNSHSNC